MLVVLPIFVLLLLLFFLCDKKKTCSLLCGCYFQYFMSKNLLLLLYFLLYYALTPLDDVLHMVYGCCWLNLIEEKQQQRYLSRKHLFKGNGSGKLRLYFPLNTLHKHTYTHAHTHYPVAFYLFKREKEALESNCVKE